MNYEEFLKPDSTTEQPLEETVEQPVSTTEDVETVEPENDLNVQKAVVESLAAEKVEQDEKISDLEKERNKLIGEISSLKESLSTMKKALENVGDILSANAETPLSNKVTLLERHAELDEAFEGETREHLLEVIREARDFCEKDGRLRRAQLLEAILVSNESTGELKKRRTILEKLFSNNQNILSGQVINELDKLGISYKNGENYLLPSEIIKRIY